MKSNELVTKSGNEIIDEVVNATCYLEALPNIIQLLFDSLHLEKLKPTAEELQDLMLCRETIRDVLLIVQHGIWDTTDKINAITVNKPKED